MIGFRLSFTSNASTRPRLIPEAVACGNQLPVMACCKTLLARFPRETTPSCAVDLWRVRPKLAGGHQSPGISCPSKRPQLKRIPRTFSKRARVTFRANFAIRSMSQAHRQECEELPTRPEAGHGGRHERQEASPAPPT